MLVVGKPVAVDAGGGQALSRQISGQEVCILLGLDKDQGSLLGIALRVLHQLLQLGALLELGHLVELLPHVAASTSNKSDRYEEVVVQKLLSRLLHFIREGGGEHQGLTIALGRLLRHVRVLYHLLNLRHKTHVQHPVCFVEDQELAVAQRDSTFLDEIQQPARCGYKNVAAPLQLTSLVEDTGAAICHHTLHHRTLGKLSSFVVNLDGQLPSWGYDNALGSSSRVGVLFDKSVKNG